MKKNITVLNITFFLFFLFLSCENSDNKKNKIVNNSPPKIEFLNKTHDFGTLIQGEKVEYNFVYKNIGGKKLKIISAEADCGCTVPKFDEKGIENGETGKINVIFDSDGFYNNQYKTIKIKTNCDSIITKLKITAFIKIN